MKNLLKLEELAMLCISIYAMYLLNAPWWCYLLLAVGPDISMIGYAMGNEVGAATYNLFHHKAIAVAILLTGLILGESNVEIAGIILFGHASMDRIFGYGLKLKQGFRFTHLGAMGRK